MEYYVNGQSTPWKDIGEGARRKVLATSKNLMLAQIEHETGVRGAMHSHPHEQITYVLSGAFVYTLNGETYTLSVGDSIYVPPNAEHGTLSLEGGVLLDVFTPQRDDFLE